MPIFYVPTAIAQLGALPKAAQVRIKKKLDFYAKQEDPLHFAKHLVGYDAYRFRIGEYRIIFALEQGAICILMIVKRDEAYSEL